MRTLTSRFERLPFIHAEWSVEVGERSTTIIGIDFDMDSFDDSLYEVFGILRPSSFHRFVRKRRSEYLAGRYCAKQSLQRLGSRITDVASTTDGCPRMPNGYIGSISHSDDVAIAVAIPETDRLHIGVDVEHTIDPSLVESIGGLTVTQTEMRQLEKCLGNPAMALCVGFSLKESLFKAAYPSVRRFFDFLDVEIIHIDSESGLAIMMLMRDMSPTFKNKTLINGVFRRINDRTIITIVTHPNSINQSRPSQ